MKSWLKKSIECLRATLEPPKHELNELDWKAALSPDKKRLTEHLSAFANYPGGGCMVFGVDGDGIPQGVHAKMVETTLNQLSNLGRAALEPPVALQHAVEAYDAVRLLFVHVPESRIKPVHIRGKGLDAAFIRSAGTTRAASRQEIGTLMLNSRTPRWEELKASTLLTEGQIVSLLEAEPIFEMLERPVPSTQEEMIRWMESEGFIASDSSGGAYITNFGAIAAACNFEYFPDLKRKAARVIMYEGSNKAKTREDVVGSRGYAITFQRLLTFVTSHLPQSEVIEQSLRQKRTVYPAVALREIIANALIH